MTIIEVFQGHVVVLGRDLVPFHSGKGLDESFREERTEVEDPSDSMMRLMDFTSKLRRT